MIIDYKVLSEDALNGVAKEFVISQINEVEELPEMDEWVNQVIHKVRTGELLIEFSEVDESVTLKHKSDIKLFEE